MNLLKPDIKCASCIRGPKSCHLWEECSKNDYMFFHAVSTACDGVNMEKEYKRTQQEQVKSDGSTASYYELPANAKELQDLISFINCNAQLGEIGRAWYRYGRCPHSEKARDLKKIIFYAQAELERLEKYEK